MPHFTNDKHDRVYRTDRLGPAAPAATEAVKTDDDPEPVNPAPAATEAGETEA